MIRIDCIVCITSPELPPMAVQNTGHMIQTETPMAVQFAGHFICRRRHVTVLYQFLETQHQIDVLYISFNA